MKVIWCDEDGGKDDVGDKDDVGNYDDVGDNADVGPPIEEWVNKREEDEVGPPCDSPPPCKGPSANSTSRHTSNS